MGNIEHVDMGAIAELKEVMEDDFGILIETFLNDSVERIAQLQSTLDAQDSVEYGRAAHSFKGSCTNIGAVALSQLCLHAEQRGKTGDLSDAPDTVREIKAEFGIVKTILEELIAN